MKITAELLKKVLIDSAIIPEKDFELAIKEAKEKTESLEIALVELGFIPDDKLGALIADATGFDFINLEKVKIEREVLEIIPEVVAEKQKIIAFERTKEGLKLAMANPDNIELKEFIERKTGEKVLPYFTTSLGISSALKYYKKEIKDEFDKIINKILGDIDKGKTKIEPLPVIKMVESILSYGYENRASDVHLEPYKEKTIVRYRIDGVLYDILTLPEELHDLLVSRIKILSKLRTDEHEAAQDGHFSFSVPKEEVDVRVSVVPIEEGEKVVMRLLAEKSRRLKLEDLGILDRNLKIIEKNLKKSWGMILSSGPTGCGKTTTLYALLEILNKRTINICTIEDPVEYDIEGINQIQVNQKTNLTFSQGLRAIVRQNPDVIMVGEIRDEETSGLAINAATTGHLVLSTFHAIDASTTLIRLQDMGIEPFLITSTVNIIISQRLVRKICPKCIESYETPYSEVVELLEEDLILKLAKKKGGKILLFRGKGCPLCQNTGYLGRTGIFEVLEMDEVIKKLIMEKANSSKIKSEAQKAGFTTMIEDGLKKVETGTTTLEEVLRAIKG